MTRWACLLGVGLAVGCGGELTVDPTSIEWGDVDFNVATPDPGHDAREITLTNSGSGDLEVVLLDLPTDRLTLGGQLIETDPPRVALGPGDVTVLTLGVSGYEPGETDTTVSGEISFDASRLSDPIPLTWSYVPKREAPDPG